MMETSSVQTFFRAGKNMTKGSIKKLQDANKDKVSEMHKTFHKIYKQKIICTNPKSNSVIKMNRIFSEFDRPTWLNGNNTTDINYGCTTNYTNSECPPPKRFFGKVGTYPLSPNNTSKTRDEDVAYLTTFFEMSSHDDMFNTLSNPRLTKKEKKQAYSRYQIEKKLSEKENDMIQKVISTEHFKGAPAAQLTCSSSGQQFFENPYKALKAIKVNSQICNKIFQMRSSMQYESYLSSYGKIMKQKEKLLQMPPVHGTKSNREKMVLLPNNSVEQLRTINDTSEDILMKNYFHKSQSGLLYRKPMSRYQLLSEVEICTDFVSVLYKPTSRSQFSLTKGEGSQLYLFGGINSNQLCDLWICDLKDNMKWSSLKVKEDDEPNPRCGHSAVYFQSCLYIYGGATPRKCVKPREDMLVFNISSCTYQTPKVQGRNSVAWRRNHIAIGIGGYMLVHGGLDDNDKILSDCWVFDYLKSSWATLDCKGSKLPALAYHSVELVVDLEKLMHPNFNLYRIPEFLVKSSNKRIKQEGIYIFGGMDDSHTLVNDLRVMKIGKKPVEMLLLNVNGMPPSPRMNSSMCFLADLNVLVIHGGRNDKDRDMILNDVMLLDIETLNWIHPTFGNYPPLPRAEHGMFNHEGKIYFLGGINQQQFHNFNFWFFTIGFYNNTTTTTQKKNNNWNAYNEALEGKGRRKTKKELLI